MQKFDVLVVGAGPSGSAAAKKCVDGGLKTLLIDRHKLPRRKACSGIISNVSQNYVFENFGPIPEKAFSKPYISKGMGFWLPSLGMRYLDVDCHQLYVWRDKFDHFLAKTSGAVLRDQTRFLRLEEKGNEIEAHLKKGDKVTKVRAKYLIGADGGHSRVIRTFAPEVYHGLPWSYAAQKYFEGTIDADDRYLHWFLTRNISPFPWMNLKDDQVIIGLAIMKGQNFEERFNRFVEFLKKNLGLQIKRELAMEACPANTMTPLNRFFPGRGHVLMVGDAMGLMHQGGEGISCGLASGGYAGQAIIEALGKGVDALARYKQLVKPEMEIALDQFNPLRMRESSASSSAHQPGILHGLSLSDKAKAMRDAVIFIKNEYEVQGMEQTILKNMLHRLAFGRYRIPAAE
jgi:flavin-dependent dehydrogenase